MTEIASLRASIELDGSGFQAGVQRVTKATGTLDGTLKRLASGHDRFVMMQERAGGVLSENAARMQAAAGAFAGITEAQDRAAESARAMAAAMDARGRVDALAASLDPLVAATQRFEAATLDVKEALALEAISAERAETVLAQLKARHDATVASMGKLGQSSGMAAANVSNLGAQFQDVFVMLGAGQNPLQLAIQQGSQISQVLGPMGARGAVRALGQAFMSLVNPVTFITVGAIAGGATLLQWLMNTGEEAEDLEDRMDGLRGSVESYRKAAENADASTRAMGDGFAFMSQRTRDFLKGLEEAERAAHLAKLEADADALARSFGSLDTAATDAMGSELERTIYAIADELGKSRGEVLGIVQAFQTLDRAGTPQEMVTAAEDLHTALMEAGMEFNNTLLVALREYIELAREGEAIADRMGNRPNTVGVTGRQYQQSLNEAAAEGIIALIRRVEGTAGANGFNTTLGNGRFTPTGRDDRVLTQMTLREILQLQRQILSHPANTFNSSALGVGQFTGTTMGGRYFTGDPKDGGGLIDALGLALDDYFTEEVQIDMIVELLRRRQGQGLTGLRQEWEGLNNATDRQILQALALDTDAVVEAEERLQEGRRNSIETGRDFIDRQKQARSAVDELRASMDPAAERMLAIADAQAAVDEAMRLTGMSAAEGAKFMADFTAAYDADAAEDQAKKIDAAQSALDRLKGKLDPTTAALLEQAEAIKTINEARAAGIEVTEAQERSLLAALAVEQMAASPAGQASIRAAEEQREAAEQAAAEFNDIWREAGQNLVDWIAGGAEGGFDALLDIGRRTLDQLAAYFRNNPLQVQTAGGGGGGILGNLMGAMGGPWGIAASIGSGLLGMFQRRRRERQERERREEQEEARREEAMYMARRGMRSAFYGTVGNVEMQRKYELLNTTPGNRDLQKHLWALEDAHNVKEEAAGIHRAVLEAQGNVTALRKLELAELAPANRALQQRLWALEDAAEKESELARLTEKRADERADLERRLLELQGNTAALRRLDLAALEPANWALQQRIWRLEDEAGRLAERDGLTRRLLDLQGRTAELRRLELRELDPANRALQQRIWKLEDEQEAERERERVADERKGLEERLLELQGNVAELRRRELEALDPTNRALQIAIWGLEDLKEALDALDASDFSSRFDFQRMRAQAANSNGGMTAGGVPLPTVPTTSAVAVSSDPQLLAEVKAMRSEQRQLQTQIEQHTYTLARLARKDDAIGLPPTRAA